MYVTQGGISEKKFSNNNNVTLEDTIEFSLMSDG